MILRLLIACVLVCGSALPLAAQFPEPPKEMEVFQHDVGNWDCEVRFYADPAAEPMLSKATEENQMLGGFWMVSKFKGEIMGAPFEGSGQFGWNGETKKYVASWVDSMSPHATCMEGTWDAATKTMTMVGGSKDPSGAEMRSKQVVVYQDNDHHTMTMYMQGPGGKEDWMKQLEVRYTRRK
jgi:hypothetical protein